MLALQDQEGIGPGGKALWEPARVSVYSTKQQNALPAFLLLKARGSWSTGTQCRRLALP